MWLRIDHLHRASGREAAAEAGQGGRIPDTLSLSPQNMVELQPPEGLRGSNLMHTVDVKETEKEIVLFCVVQIV